MTQADSFCFCMCLLASFVCSPRLTTKHSNSWFCMIAQLKRFEDIENLLVVWFSHPPLRVLELNGISGLSFFINKKLLGAPPATYSTPKFLFSSYEPTPGP